MNVLTSPHSADAEDQEQVRPDHRELGERGVAVVLVQVLELGEEVLVRDQLQVLGHESAFFAPVHREDVVGLGLAAKPDEHVVAEEEPLAQRDHVARDAVVLRGDPLGGQQLGLDGAEDGLAGVVELVEPAAEFRGVLGQPVANDLVRAALELHRILLSFGRVFFLSVLGHVSQPSSPARRLNVQAGERLRLH